MTPVLAIAGLVANVVVTIASLTPLGRFLNLSSPGRTDRKSTGELMLAEKNLWTRKQRKELHDDYNPPTQGQR